MRDGAPVWTAGEWKEFFLQAKETLEKEAKGTKRRARELAIVDEYIERISKYRTDEPLVFLWGGWHKDYMAPAAKAVMVEQITCRVGFLRSLEAAVLVQKK